MQQIQEILIQPFHLQFPTPDPPVRSTLSFPGSSVRYANPLMSDTLPVGEKRRPLLYTVMVLALYSPSAHNRQDRDETRKLVTWDVIATQNAQFFLHYYMSLLQIGAF